MTSIRPFFKAIALIAAIGGIASLLGNSRHQQQPRHNLRIDDEDRRQLSLIDPKTVELRPPGPAPTVAISDAAITNNANNLNAGRLPPHVIAARPEDLQRFPYHTATEQCVPPQDIIDISEFIKDLYLTHGVRTFPRNGFLLGIIRHGGFLPIENVDVDMGVVYEDLVGLGGPDFKIGSPRKSIKGMLGDLYSKGGGFKVRLDPVEDFWVNWKGIEPLSQRKYPYFGAMISRGGYRLHAYAAYQYRNRNEYFYPRLDKIDFNHAVHVKDAIRYNTEGGDYRLVDTDERINKKNLKVKDEKQVATIFNTTFNCFMETKFYFTTIIVPCEYDSMLTAQFGENWKYVERRGARGGPRRETQPVTEEENAQLLNGGPRPVCVS